jgi:hypothetical protein
LITRFNQNERFFGFTLQGEALCGKIVNYGGALSNSFLIVAGR